MPTDPSQAQLRELLPWYVNGTLPAREREDVERFLAEHPYADEEVRFLEEVATVSRVDSGSFDEELIRAEVQRLVEQDRDTSHLGGSEGWLQRLGAWLRFEPKVAFAVAVIGVQGLAIAGLLLRTEQPSFSETRSQASGVEPAGPVYRVTFSPTAPERDIRLLLVAVGAQIVAGPSQLGDYYLSFGPALTSEKRRKLESSPLIDSLKALDRLPGEYAGEK